MNATHHDDDRLTSRADAAPVTTDPRRDARVLGIVMAAASLPVAAGVVWVILVDRTTVRGAIRDTEETIEGRWLEKAQSGALLDLVVVLGLGTAVVTFTGWRPELPSVGVALLLFAAASVAVRYLLQKRRG